MEKARLEYTSFPLRLEKRNIAIGEPQLTRLRGLWCYLCLVETKLGPVDPLQTPWEGKPGEPLELSGDLWRVSE
jgi:hypothetical protein